MRIRGTKAGETSNAGGFSLIETLVATAIMIVAVLSIAQILAVSTRANQSANATTFASILAEQKIEQLRGLTWGFDAGGLPLSDLTSDTTVTPELPIGGSGLAPSPPWALEQNTTGYCDFLDARGQSVPGGTRPPAGTAYIRRWAIHSLPTNPTDTLVLQVLVTRWPNRETADGDTAGGNRFRFPDEARIVSMKTRKAE